VDSALRAKLERCTTLPTLPAVAFKVLDLCQRENLDLAEIAKVIGNDPALAAKMLKTVNSPAFALRQEVRTLTHAVALLGVNSVRTLVLSFSLMRDVRRSQRASLAVYWKRSMLAALAAREVSAAVRFPFREEAFLAGLLQDIGMLALRQLGDPVYNDLLESAAYDHDRVSAGERSAFDSDHAAVGAWLITRWRVPDRFRVAVANSHRPYGFEDDDDDMATLVRLTALSGVLADIWIHPDAAGAAQRAHIEAAKLFRLPNLSLEEVVRNMSAALPEISSLFEVDLGSIEAMNEVLEKARETLAFITVQGVPTPRLVPAVTDDALASDRRPAAPPAGPRDPVTGLADRGFAERYLAEERVTARRDNEPVSVILAEVDDAGAGAELVDPVLRHIAQALGTRLRKRDVLARVARGSFMFVLPETNGAGAVVVAERARAAVAALQTPGAPAGKPGLTMSFGCATAAPEDSNTAAEIIAHAAAALAGARASGGNRVSVHRPAAA
jgi:diguanylate cyclase (GGDEF)-like protein